LAVKHAGYPAGNCSVSFPYIIKAKPMTNFDRLAADLETYCAAQIASGADPDEFAGALLIQGTLVAATQYDRPKLAAALRRLADIAERPAHG
jgi:hypothetical protein